MKRNLTVQVDEAVIAKARVLAARRSSSVSRLLSEEISRLVDEDDRYQRVLRRTPSPCSLRASGSVVVCFPLEATFMTGDVAFVDTNVLVYAYDTEAGRKHDIAAQL